MSWRSTSLRLGGWRSRWPDSPWRSDPQGKWSLQHAAGRENATAPDELVGGAGRVGADQDRLLLAGLPGQLGERQVDHLHLIGGGVGRGVARPQDRGQRLAGAVAAVQPGRQRMEPEPTLVGPGSALLVG